MGNSGIESPLTTGSNFSSNVSKPTSNTMPTQPSSTTTSNPIANNTRTWFASNWKWLALGIGTTLVVSAIILGIVLGLRPWEKGNENNSTTTPKEDLQFLQTTTEDPTDKDCPQLKRTTAKENMKIVKELYQSVFGDKIFTGVDKYIHEDLIQHTPWVADGLKAFVDYLPQAVDPNSPKKIMKYEHEAAEKDLVWLHINANPYGVIDIYRIKCGKIAEHWDVLENQVETLESIKSNNQKIYPHPFFGDVKMPDSANCRKTTPKENINIVREMYQKAFGDQINDDSLNAFIREDYVQHNPWYPDGLQAFKTALPDIWTLNPTLVKGSKINFKRISSDNGFVWLHKTMGTQLVVAEIFRIQCGLIAEHWDIIQNMTETLNKYGSKNPHPFF